jgi:hypothetical protein
VCTPVRDAVLRSTLRVGCRGDLTSRFLLLCSLQLPARPYNKGDARVAERLIGSSVVHVQAVLAHSLERTIVSTKA